MSIPTDTQFRLRLPAGLHARVKAASETNLRSINAEIAHTLEAAYPPAPEPESVNLEMLEALRDALGTIRSASRALSEEHKLALGGKPWGGRDIAAIEAVIAKAEGW